VRGRREKNPISLGFWNFTEISVKIRDQGAGGKMSQAIPGERVTTARGKRAGVEGEKRGGNCGNPERAH